MAGEEQRQENALNGIRARRFGGAINYAKRPVEAAQPAGLKVDDIPPVTQHYDATPVQAQAPNINTTMPAIPNVQPTAPTTQLAQAPQAQGAALAPAPINGTRFGTSSTARPTPTQLNARPTCESGLVDTERGLKFANRSMQERQEPTNTANEVNSPDKSFLHIHSKGVSP